MAKKAAEMTGRAPESAETGEAAQERGGASVGVKEPVEDWVGPGTGGCIFDVSKGKKRTWEIEHGEITEIRDYEANAKGPASCKLEIGFMGSAQSVKLPLEYRGLVEEGAAVRAILRHRGGDGWKMNVARVELVGLYTL